MIKTFRYYFDSSLLHSKVQQQVYATVKYFVVFGAVIIYRVSLPGPVLKALSDAKGLCKQIKGAAAHNYLTTYKTA